MEAAALKAILDQHALWLSDNTKGKQADLSRANLSWENLRGANLRRANLSRAELRGANLSRANLRGANLSWADLSWANLSRANLRGANLTRADLNGADLRGADLDFSVWPLWCGSLDVTVDARIAAQLAYHFCRLKCDDEEVKSAQAAIRDLANAFHRKDDCGAV